MHVPGKRIIKPPQMIHREDAKKQVNFAFSSSSQLDPRNESRVSLRAPCSKMRGIGKVREFIYSGNSYDLSQQSSQEGEPRINSAFRRSRPQSSTHGSMQSGEDGAHGRDEDMDDAFADGMILSPAADRDGAVPFVPPQGR